ncbi:hypothetical protein N0V90_001859 [Kalmusia sp. IMI 367209]|nr:hypothetical protein N0V90_001859 [Kalmusia sp. IMI 367209]
MLRSLSKIDHFAGLVPHIAQSPQIFSQVYITFISLARNLHALAIGDYFFSLGDLNPQGHSNLREVLGIFPGECGEVRLVARPTTGYNPLLILMRTITHASGNDGWRFGWGSREVFHHNKPQPVLIEEITIDKCNLDDWGIEMLLQHCTLLRRFICRWSMMRKNSGGVQINLEGLRRHLEPFQYSLECLVLDTLDSTWQVGLDEVIPTIGNLRGFSALKHLDVSGMVLWSDDDTVEQPRLASILPPNLQTLVINVEWDDYVEEGLAGLSEDCAFQAPNLRSVNCSWRPAPSPIAEALIAEFKDVGVTLELAMTESTEEEATENAQGVCD